MSNRVFAPFKPVPSKSLNYHFLNWKDFGPSHFAIELKNKKNKSILFPLLFEKNRERKEKMLANFLVISKSQWKVSTIDLEEDLEWSCILDKPVENTVATFWKAVVFYLKNRKSGYYSVAKLKNTALPFHFFFCYLYM